VRSGVDDEALIRLALAEDLPHGDITSEATVPAGVQAVGRFVAKEDLVVAGTAAAAGVFALVDASLAPRWLKADGERVAAGSVFGEVHGPARSMLAAERTALNLLQRLAGVATLTRAFVDLLAGTSTRLLDTRKTTPGMRLLQRQAVCAGGGYNHRFSLSEAILIKTNHVRLAGTLTAAVAGARARAGHLMKVEVEVADLAQLEQALSAGADVVLLDNMTVADVAEAARRARARGVVSEVSGGITLDNVRDYAAAGVDFVSVGALTHSARAMDISLRLETEA